MKAILCNAFGLPNTLVYEENVVGPTLEPGKVLIDVHACSLNFPDTLTIRDMYQFKPPLPFSPGSAESGVVRGGRGAAMAGGGESIGPSEVATAIAGHGECGAGRGAGTPDSEWGQRVVARVVPRNTAEPPSLDALREFAARAISRHKLPRAAIIVDHPDRTPPGKIPRS